MNKGHIVVILATVLVLVVGISFLIIDAVLGTIYWSNFIPEFMAGALGVLLGFGFGFMAEDMRERSKARVFLGDLLEELEFVCDFLEPDPNGHRMMQVPTRIWTMGIMSGLFALLDDDVRFLIYGCYLSIEGFNYKSEIYTRIETEGNVNEEETKRYAKYLKTLAEETRTEIQEMVDWLRIEQSIPSSSD